MRIHFLVVAKNYSSDIHLKHKRQYNLCVNNNEEEARGTVNVLFSLQKEIILYCHFKIDFANAFPESMKNEESDRSQSRTQHELCIVMLYFSKDNNSTEQVSCHTVQIIIRVHSAMGYTDHQSQES